MRNWSLTVFIAALIIAAVWGGRNALGAEDLGGRLASAQASPRGDLGEQAESLADGRAFVLGVGQQPAGTHSWFFIRAHAGLTQGGNVTADGVMTFETADPQPLLWDAKVTCVTVTGNDAVVTGVVNLPARYSGQHIVMEALDSGRPDRVRFSFEYNGGVVAGSSPNCWRPVFGPVPIEGGFVEVVARRR